MINNIRRIMILTRPSLRRICTGTPMNPLKMAGNQLEIPSINPLRIGIGCEHSFGPGAVAHISTKAASKRIRIPKPKIKMAIPAPKTAIQLTGEDNDIEELDPIANKRVELIKNLFELPDETKAETLLNMYPKIRYQDEENILEIRDFLVQKGVSVDRFLYKPLMFTLPKKMLNDKVENIKKLLRIDNFQTAIAFLEFSMQRLFQLGHLWKTELHLVNVDPSENEPIFKNRIEYLAHHLRCEQFQVADMMLKVPGTLSRPFPSVKDKLKLLLDNGIQPEDIVRDPYIFLHTTKKIEARLAMTKLNGLHQVKPWLLRCVQATYDSYVDRLTEEQALLSGHKDIKSFLSKRLGCSPGLVSDILFRVPSVKRASASKLNDMIEFLYAHGFRTDHILETPRILGHSVDTINQRITELASYGFKINSLFLLCQTTKHYNAFVRKLRNDVVAGTED